MFTTMIQVALGGAIGATARYLTNVGVMRFVGPGFPWGTAIVNVVGSFLMGALVVILMERFGNRLAPFLMTGLLGGFTTFSAFSLDAVTLWERGQTATAGLYVIGSVVLSISALVAGLTLTRSLFS
jgi:CrcB protein